MLKVEHGVNVIPPARAKRSKALFKALNASYMVPANRLGLFPWMLNPLTGYILVLKLSDVKVARNVSPP